MYDRSVVCEEVYLALLLFKPIKVENQVVYTFMEEQFPYNVAAKWFSYKRHALEGTYRSLFITDNIHTYR